MKYEIKCNNNFVFRSCQNVGQKRNSCATLTPVFFCWKMWDAVSMATTAAKASMMPAGGLCRKTLNLLFTVSSPKIL